MKSGEQSSGEIPRRQASANPKGEYLPQKGDLISINFSPHKGREQGFRRPAIVLSPITYNSKTRLVIVCPITLQVKGYPFEVPLPAEMATSGVVLADHIKSLDWIERGAVFVEVAPAELWEEVLAKIDALLF